MKTKFKFLMAAFVLTAGFTGCSNDNDGPGPGPIEGKATGLKIAIPVVRTYADDKAKDTEVAFISATVFIYNGGSLEKDTTLHVGDFSFVGSTWEMNSPIKVMSGTKNVYVGLNLSTDDVAAVRSGLHASYAVAGGAAGIIDTATVQTKGFAMFSANYTYDPLKTNTFEIEPDMTNTISIPVERWAAKVTCMLGENATPDQDASGAIINDFSFALGQVNKKMFPFQKLLTTGIIEDPNWSSAPAGDFTNEFGSNASITTSAYKSANTYVDELTDRETKYALENTGMAPRTQGDATYISVRASFTPKAYHTYNGTAVSEVTPKPTTVPTDLYVVETATGEAFYFQVESEATAYAGTLTGAKVGHYKNGLCYYFVFLDDSKNTDNDYAVIRNTYYDSRITKVNSLGYPDPEVPNPDKPLSKFTELEVNVEIINWEYVLTNEELGKI